MKKKKLVTLIGSFCLVLVLAALPFMAACVEPTPPTGRPIKVGIVDCYSGGATTYTYDVRDAFKLAIDEINEEGILGTTIEFTTRDSKFEPALALSMAKELVMMEKVDILMGTINSAGALAISDYCKTEKVPFLVTFSKSAKITGEKGHRYVFSMNENTAMAGKAGAVGLAEKPYIKYWIGGDDYEYGHAIANGVWNNLKILKPEVELIGESWWKVGEPDFTPYITAMLAAKPDAVIIATGGADCVPFLKAAKVTGFNEAVPFYMHTATELATLAPLGADAPEGVIGTANFPFMYPDTAENRDFYEKFQAAYDRHPKVGALYGYITAQFIAEALKKAGAMDTEKFIDALEGLKVDSPVGKVEMRAYDHQVILPMFMGVTKKVSEYDFLIASDIVTIPGKDVMPAIEEIKAARGE